MAVPSQPRNVESLLWSFPIFKVSTNPKHNRVKVQFSRKRKITFWALFFVKSIYATKHSVEKCYKPRSRFLRKNQHSFREINVHTKEVTKELISRNFFCVIAFCKKVLDSTKFLLAENHFPVKSI